MMTRIQKGSSIYAVYELENKELVVDRISVSMINNNQNKQINLAPISLEEINGVFSRMLFDVTGKVTLKEFIGKNITQQYFRIMITNLVNTLISLDEVMIDLSQIILNIEDVYINEIDLSVSFLCAAFKNSDKNGNLPDFFRAIIENSHVAVASNEKDYFHCVWNVIRSRNGFSLENILKVMSGTSEGQYVPQMDNNMQPSVQNESPSYNNAAMQQPSFNVMPGQTEVTVSSQSNQNMPVAKPDYSKDKKSLFGKIFSSSKKKNEDDDKIPDNPNKKPDKKYQGGVSRFKTGNNEKVQPDQTNNSRMNFNPGMVNGNGQPINCGNGVNNISSPNNRPQMMPQGYQENNPQSEPRRTGTVIVKGGSPVQNTNMSQPPVQIENNPVPVPDQPQQIRLQKPSQMQPCEFSAAPQEETQRQTGTVILSNNVRNTATTLISDGNQHVINEAYLIRKKTGQKIIIDKPVFCIGREQNDQDLCINENTAVGHAHAEIINRNGEYFIVDKNSKNFTYVNDYKIKSSIEENLYSGDRIAFANEEFEFWIK